MFFLCIKLLVYIYYYSSFIYIFIYYRTCNDLLSTKKYLLDSKALPDTTVLYSRIMGIEGEIGLSELFNIFRTLASKWPKREVTELTDSTATGKGSKKRRPAAGSTVNKKSM